MFSVVENVRNVPCEKFGKVPPVGRCAKQLTFSRWILPNDPVINIWEGIKRVRLNRVGGCFAAALFHGWRVAGDGWRVAGDG